jgi:hypothetical protein
MNNTPLEDQVHDALHRRVDPLQHAPLTVTDVRRRAGRIQLRRRVAAGAAVAAVLAVAVPVGLSVTGPAQRSEVPPATHSPTLSGPVRIDPRSADVSATPPGVPLVDTTVPKVAAGSAELDLPQPYEQVTPYRDGWIASLHVDGDHRIDVLDATFTVLDETTGNSELTVSPDGTRIAWAFHNGDHWSIINNDVAGEEAERPWTAVPDGAAGSTVGTVGFVSDDEVLAYQLDERTGTISTFLADGDEVVPLPGIDQAVSASPATGMIAARTTTDDGASCAATFDGRTRAATPIWTDCDHELGPFTPDGTRVVGFAPTPDGDHPGLSILDAGTGASLVDFEVTGARNRVVGIASQVVWEDDEHLLATYTDGNQQYVVRLGLDGAVERVAGPVTVDPGQVALRLTPGNVE